MTRQINILYNSSFLENETATVASYEASTTECTLHTASPHTFLVNQIITVSGLPARYNGTFTITGVNSALNTLTYVKSGSLQSLTAVNSTYANNSVVTTLSGWTTVNINDDLYQSSDFSTYTVTKSLSTTSSVTLTTSVAHSLYIGQQIAVAGVGIRFDGDYIITGTTATTVTYAKTGSAYSLSDVTGASIATTPHSWWGDYSAAVIKSSSAYPGLISDLIPITGGLQYSLSAQVLLPITDPITNAAEMIIRIDWYETAISVAPIANSTASSIPQTIYGNEEWNLLAIEGAIAPDNATYARVSVVENTGSSLYSGEVFYVDAMMLTQSQYVYPYVNNYVQKQENKIVNTALSPEPVPHISGMQLNADISLGKLIFNTIDEDETLWVCTDIDGWWTLSDPEIPDIPRGVQDGSYDITGRYQSRTMSLTGVFLPKNAAGVAKARKKLLEAVNLTRRGGWLNTAEEPVVSSFVKLAGRPQIQTVNARGRTEFSIPLRAADPIKYEWNHAEPDGYTYLTIQPDATANVQNIGNADVTAKFTVTGPVDVGTNIYDARTDEVITLISGLRGGGDPIAYVTKKEIFNEIATLTTADKHNLVVGDKIIVSGMGAPFDTNNVRTYTISAVETTFSNSISFPMPAGTSTLAETSTAGTVALESSDVLEIDTYTRTVTLNGENYGARASVDTLVDWIKLKPGTNYIQFNEVITPYEVQYKSYYSDLYAITNKALSSGNVATLTTSIAHGYSAGISVVVEGVDSTFNGRYTIKAVPTSTTFTYDKVAAPVSSTSATGTVSRKVAVLTTKNAHFLKVGETVNVALPESAEIIRKELTSNKAILTTAQPHGFSIGDVISVNTTANTDVTKKSLTSNYAGLTLNAASAVVAGDSVTVTLPTTTTINNKQRTDDTVTLTTGTTHGFVVGDKIEVSLPVTATPTAKEIQGTTAKITTSAGHNFSLNDKIALELPLSASATNKVLSLTDATITTSAAHGFSVGDWILPNLPASTALTSISSVRRKYTKDVAQSDNCQVTLNTGTHKFSVGDTITVNVGVTSTITPTQRASSTRTRTLTFASAHNFSVGEGITVTGIDANYNGTYMIDTVVDSTSFTYVAPDKTIDIVNKSLTSNVATLTTGAPHKFAVGESVTVSSVNSTFNGTYVVTEVPSAITFSYAKTASNVTSTAVSPAGSVVNSLSESTTSAGGTASVRNNMIADGYNGTKVVTAKTSTSLSYFYYGLNQITTTSNIAGTSPTIINVTNKTLNKTVDITTKALTSNLATLTTSTPHGYAVDDVIVVADVDSTFNGTYKLTGVTETTVSYVKSNTNVTSTASVGTVTKGVQITSIPTTTSFVYSR